MAFQHSRRILGERGLAPAKSRGQNFLVHRHTAERIVDLAELGPGDCAVEVGVGLGALTRILARRAGRIIGLELDRGLVRYLREEGDLPDNVELRHEDVLKADLAALARECGGPLVIVANLPYSISSPFLFRLMEERAAVDRAVVMLQKEVALRLRARSGSKAYGALSVLIQALARVEPLMDLGPAEFHPRPRVDSQVVRITMLPGEGLLEGLDPRAFRRLVNAAFAQRRKTLVNSLAGAGLMDKDRARSLLAARDLPEGVRAERLDTADFIALARAWQDQD